MDEKKLQQEFILFLSEKLLAKDEQDLRDKVKNLSQDDMEKYYEEFSKKKLKKAAHGAKLGYFKRLKHQCAEDEELVYFKKGGSVGCGCVKKEEGGKTPTKKKVIKQDLATKDSIAANVYNDEEIQNTRPGSYKNNKNGKLQWTPDRTKAPYKKENGGGLKKNCGGATIKLKKKGGEVCPKCGKIHAAGMGCASKFKMHRLGGSLNRIPFYLEGKSIKLHPSKTNTSEYAADSIYYDNIINKFGDPSKRFNAQYLLDNNDYGYDQEEDWREDSDGKFTNGEYSNSKYGIDYGASYVDFINNKGERYREISFDEPNGGIDDMYTPMYRFRYKFDSKQNKYIPTNEWFMDKVVTRKQGGRLKKNLFGGIVTGREAYMNRAAINDPNLIKYLNKANAYFNSAPTLYNLGNGVWNKLKSLYFGTKAAYKADLKERDKYTKDLFNRGNYIEAIFGSPYVPYAKPIKTIPLYKKLHSNI